MSDEIRKVTAEEWDSYPVDNVRQVTAEEWDSYPIEAESGPGWNEWLSGIGREQAQGASLEFADEILGTLSAGASYLGIPEAIGALIGKTPHNTSYDDFTNVYRGKRKQFAAENPGTALGANFVGGLALPTGIVGKVLGKVAPGVAKAGPLVNAMADAAVAGAGAGEGSNRITGAAVGGGLSGAVAGAGGAGGRVIRNAMDWADGFDPAIMRVARKLVDDGITEQAGREALETIQDAHGMNVPLNVVEAFSPPYSPGGTIPKSSISNYAAMRAQTTPGSIRMANDLILGRESGRLQRINEALDMIASSPGQRAGATQFSEAATQAVNRARKSLMDVEGAAYRELYKEFPALPASQINSLKKRFPSLKEGIKRVKRNVDALVNEPDNSTKVLNRVRSQMSKEAYQLSRTDPQRANDIMAALNKVDEVLSESTIKDGVSLFDQAKTNYAKRLKDNPELYNTKGLIQRMEKLSPESANPTSKLKELYGTTAKDPSDIDLIKSQLGDEMNRLGLRVGLGESIPDKSRYNLAQRLVGDEGVLDQIRRSLPSDEAEDLIRRLNYEHQVAESRALTTGSQTARQQSSLLQDAIERGGLSYSEAVRKALSALTEEAGRDQAAKDALVMFSSGEPGVENLSEILRYITKSEKWRPKADAARSVVHTTGKTLTPNFDKIMRIIIGGQ